MHSSLARMDIEKSGVSHHMMFQKQYLTELFELVQQNHNMDFWKAFINCIDPAAFSGASEYEMYFNFMLKYHPDKIIVRKPRFKCIRKLDELHTDAYDFVSYHHWCR